MFKFQNKIKKLLQQKKLLFVILIILFIFAKIYIKKITKEDFSNDSYELLIKPKDDYDLKLMFVYGKMIVLTQKVILNLLMHEVQKVLEDPNMQTQLILMLQKEEY
jgi:hypothetical protein